MLPLVVHDTDAPDSDTGMTTHSRFRLPSSHALQSTRVDPTIADTPSTDTLEVWDTES